MQPYSSPAAARLILKNKPIPDRILAVPEFGYSLRFSDPPLGVEWCCVAADVSSSVLDPRIRGQVLGYFGNSLRVVGRYTNARETIERSLKILPGDPLLLEFKGSLLRDVRELDEAAECFEAASRMRKAAGDIAGFARTILSTAQVMDQAGQSRDAARLCLKSLDLLEAPVDPARNLLRTTIQNYATFLCNAGKPLDALRALRKSESILSGGEPFFQLRLDWVFGKIAAALRDESAESRLESVRKRLEEGGLIQEAALATLDLARYYVRQRDPRASSVALSVAPLLQTLEIERDAREAELLSRIAKESSKEGSNVEHLISELSAAIAARPQVRQVA